MPVLHLIANDEGTDSVCVCVCSHSKQKKSGENIREPEMDNSLSTGNEPKRRRGREQQQRQQLKKKVIKIGASGFKASAQITIERTDVCLTCVRSSNINQI